MELMKLARELFPVCRSITGDGVRETLKRLGEIVPLQVSEFSSGTEVFDWTIPKEWNIRDAYVKDLTGKRIIDFKKSNLHVLGYSIPVNTRMKGAELKNYIYTLEEMPEAIPYKTSYYKERWGFCLEHNRVDEIDDNAIYEVCIDSTLEDGSLTIAEGYIKGETDKEIFLSTYICHPSMANNELSGPLVQTEIYRRLMEVKDKLRYSYRFAYVPETIGSITYLAHYGDVLKEKVIAGYVLTCCGDEGDFTYKRSRQKNALVDRATENVLKSYGQKYKVVEWSPLGSDERQYCSLGFNLPMGSLTKTMYDEYYGYHTSLDNLDFISEKGLQSAVDAYWDIIQGIEVNDKYLNLNPCCEPQLGKRGLYPSLGYQKDICYEVDKILFLLAYSDGKMDIVEIADKFGGKASEFRDTVEKLVTSGLLERVK